MICKIHCTSRAEQTRPDQQQQQQTMDVNIFEEEREENLFSLFVFIGSLIYQFQNKTETYEHGGWVVVYTVLTFL